MPPNCVDFSQDVEGVESRASPSEYNAPCEEGESPVACRQLFCGLLRSAASSSANESTRFPGAPTLRDDPCRFGFGDRKLVPN